MSSPTRLGGTPCCSHETCYSYHSYLLNRGDQRFPDSRRHCGLPRLMQLLALRSAINQFQQGIYGPFDFETSLSTEGCDLSALHGSGPIIQNL